MLCLPSTQEIAAAPVAVVQITSSGFVPSTIEVKAGTKVVWVNYDQLPHQIAADPYPSIVSYQLYMLLKL